jgi:hypothetical protein
VFCDVSPFSEERYRNFGVTYNFHLQDRKARKVRKELEDAASLFLVLTYFDVED